MYFLLNCEMLEDVFAKRNFLGAMFSPTQQLLSQSSFLFWFTCFTYFSQQHFLGNILKIAFRLMGKMKCDLCLIPAEVLWIAVPMLYQAPGRSAVLSLLLSAREGHLSGTALETQRMALSKQMLL